MSPTQAIDSAIDAIRESETVDPTLPRFDLASVPCRAVSETELAWSFRALDRLAAWRDMLARRALTLAVCRLAAIATVHALNGER